MFMEHYLRISRDVGYDILSYFYQELKKNINRPLSPNRHLMC